MRALLAAVLLSGAFALSCGDQESSGTTTTPSPTASLPASSSSTAPPTTSPTPPSGALLTLTEALAGGETLAQRPVGRPNLVYGVKEGKHVRVFLHDVASGAEQLLLEYDEDVEAQHSGNLWEEEPASIALARAGRLVYVRGFDVHTYDVASGIDAALLRAQDLSPTPGELDLRQWTSDAGAVLCCAYHLATPLISPSGDRVVFSMSQWEGGLLGVIAANGTSACKLPNDPESGSITSLHPAWGPQGQLAIPASGEYSANGLYAAPADAPCSPAKLMADDNPDLTGFETAGWSPDGLTIAASYGTSEPPSASLWLFKGGEKQLLLDHSLSYWPQFSPDGRYIYYVLRTARLYFAASETIWRYDTQTAESKKIAEVPDGWSAWTRGWTDEEYMILRLQSSDADYWSTGNRVVLLDPATGGVVYASAGSDFTTYAGFLP